MLIGLGDLKIENVHLCSLNQEISLLWIDALGDSFTVHPFWKGKLT